VVAATPRRGNKPKEGTGHASAATSARDTDSSVEKHPGAGRRRGQSATWKEAEGTTRTTLNPGGSASGRRATNGRDRGSGSDVRRRVPGRSPPRAIEGSEAGSWTRSARAGRRTRSGPTGDSLQSEPRSEQPQPGDRRFDTIQAHVAIRERGNPLADGQTAHRSTTPIAARRTEDGFGSLAGSSETTEPAATDRAARHPPRLRTRSERSPSATVRSKQATNGRRGAGRSDAVRLPTRRKPSKGGAPAGTTDPARGASAPTTDPPETWRTQTRYRLQHAGSRERRKPSRW